MLGIVIVLLHHALELLVHRRPVQAQVPPDGIFRRSRHRAAPDACARARTSTPLVSPADRRRRRVVVVASSSSLVARARASRLVARAPSVPLPRPLVLALASRSPRLAAPTHSSPSSLYARPLSRSPRARLRVARIRIRNSIQTTLPIPPSRLAIRRRVFRVAPFALVSNASSAARASPAVPRVDARRRATRARARAPRARECAVRIIRVDRACPNRLGFCAMCERTRYTRQTPYRDRA